MLTFATQTGLNLAIIALKIHKKCRVIFLDSENMISAVLDRVLGFLLGGIVGWLIGWQAGSVCRHLFEPVAAMSFDEVRFWYELPQTAAHKGMLAGGLVGLIVVHVYSQILRRKRGEG